MANLVVLDDKLFTLIRGKIGVGGITVLMPKSLAKKHGLEDGDERFDAYICGREADVWVELVTNDDHYVFSWLEEKKAEEMEGD